VVERFNNSIKYEHLYRLESPTPPPSLTKPRLTGLYNEIRPHESLDFATPLSRYLTDPEPNLFLPESVQDS
jgi:transposase InsO family protein